MWGPVLHPSSSLPRPLGFNNQLVWPSHPAETMVLAEEEANSSVVSCKKRQSYMGWLLPVCLPPRRLAWENCREFQVSLVYKEKEEKEEKEGEKEEGEKGEE